MRRKLKRMLSLRAILLALTLILCAEGCGTLPQGIGRRPIIKVSESVKFSDEETKFLHEFSAQHMELAKKVIGRNNELAAAIESYNKAAVEHNRDIMQKVGFSDDEISKLYPKHE